MTLGAIGWAVVHSAWQWLLILALTVLVLARLPHARPAVRYGIAGASLGLMLATFAVTAILAEHAARLPLRGRLLYAFDGLPIIPVITPAGYWILRVSALLWITGVLVSGLRIASAWRRAARLRQDGLHRADRAVENDLQDVACRVGVTRAVDLRRSNHATVPMLLGWRTPLILLPLETTERLSRTELRAILAHELGHVRRRDYLANVGQLAADALTFHHPAARWVSRRIRAEREYCCDDIAVEACGDALTYARALAALEDARADAALAVAAASGTLLDRIERVVGRPRAWLTPARGVALAAAVGVLSGMLFIVALNVPGPSVPSGVRMRRPAPEAEPTHQGLTAARPAPVKRRSAERSLVP